MRTDRQHPALALALARSTHPGPTLAVTLITVLLGAGAGLEPWRLVVLGAAMLCGQASVGLSNDWLDADRDRAVGRADKPVARGEVGIQFVRGASFATGVLGIVVTLPLGLPATVAHALFIAAGWAYNLWLKRTVLSVLPYVVGFGVLPAIVTLALPPSPALPAIWALAAGALLGVAAHFANALPDLDADRATGVVGLPHRMGARASGTVTFAALVAASGLIVFGPGMPGFIGWACLGVEAAIAIVGTILALTRAPGRPLFRLVIIGALVAVAALVLSGQSLVG